MSHVELTFQCGYCGDELPVEKEAEHGPVLGRCCSGDREGPVTMTRDGVILPDVGSVEIGWRYPRE